MAYGYYATVTVAHGKVGSGGVTSFPVCVSFTNAAFKSVANGGYIQNTTTNNGQTVPADVIFTSDSGGTTLLNWEVESWDPVNGIIVAWVQSSLSSSADTVFYVFLGNASVTTWQSPGIPWTSDKEGVWHFPNGSSLSVVDSTGNQSSSNSSALATPGFVDGCAQFSSGTHVVASTGKILGGGSAWTMAAWVNTTASSLTDGRSIYSERATSGSDILRLDSLVSSLPATGNKGKTAGISYRNDGGTLVQVFGQVIINDGNWHRVVGILSSATLYLYVDGSLDTSAAWSSNNNFTNAGIQSWVGSDNGDNSAVWSNDIDELELSNIAWSTAWITTDYNSQFSPSTFFTLGPVTRLSGGGLLRAAQY